MAKTIQIRGAEELTRKLKRLPGALEAASRRAVKGEVDEATEDLRADAPVLSGDLRDSVQGEIDKNGLGGRAVITAAHAEFVIHGTTKQPANDFVTPVENQIRRRFPNRLTDEINDEIRKA